MPSRIWMEFECARGVAQRREWKGSVVIKLVGSTQT